MREMTPREEQRADWAKELLDIFTHSTGEYSTTSPLEEYECEQVVELIEDIIEAALARRGFTAQKEESNV